MSARHWLLIASAALLAIGLVAVACGGGKESSGPLDLSRIPTATLPNPLPEPLLLEGVVPSGGGNRYVVEEGDSLSEIADRFGTSVEAIAEANGIDDPTQLVVGQVLTIPGVARPPEASETVGATAEPRETPAPAPDDTPVAPEGQVYIVQEGDIPETIAAQFGITADELMAANGITDPTSLQIGQELIIPTPSAQDE